MHVLAVLTVSLMLLCCVRLSSVTYVLWLNCVVRSLEQKLLLTAYRKSCVKNRLVPK